MNTSMISSNTVAFQNGKIMENFVTSLFPDIKINNDTIDAEYKDVKVEIKSCQSRIKGTGKNSNGRNGNFVFEGSQHKKLLEENGEYFFIVQENLVPKVFFRCSAEAVGLPEFTGVKSVCWRTVAKRVL